MIDPIMGLGGQMPAYAWTRRSTRVHGRRELTGVDAGTLTPDIEGAGMGTMTTETPTEQGPRPRRRAWVTVLAVLTTVVMVGVLGAAGYAFYLDRLVDRSLTRQDLLPDQAPTALGTPQPQSPARSPQAGDALNMLFVGTDERPGESRGRSDVMVVVHVDRNRSRVTLVHLPRDMQVAIPGHGEDKINAGYAYGGAPLLVRTVQDMLGMRIDNVVQIGFEGFRAMTDAVGGVEVDVAEGSPAFPAGRRQLDGAAALDFVRERYTLPEGDISRGRRQQAFLKGILLKALSAQTLADPRRLTAFVEAAASNATVDSSMTTETVRSLALELRSLRGGDIRFITAPISGFATRADGASIDVVDIARMKQLGKALALDDMSSYPS